MLDNRAYLKSLISPKFKHLVDIELTDNPYKHIIRGSRSALEERVHNTTVKDIIAKQILKGSKISKINVWLLDPKDVFVLELAVRLKEL